MTTYAVILDSEIDPESPMTTSLWFRTRDNPLAIFEGDATAIAASKALAIEYDSGSGTQTGIITDVTDQTLSLKPDGSGGAIWGPGAAGQFFAGEIDGASTTVGNEITWTEIVDTGNDFSGSAFTVPSDGTYDVYVNIGSSNNAGVNQQQLFLKVNANTSFQELSNTEEINGVNRKMTITFSAGDLVSVYLNGVGSATLTGWSVGVLVGSDPVISLSGKAYFSIRRVA